MPWQPVSKVEYSEWKEPGSCGGVVCCILMVVFLIALGG